MDAGKRAHFIELLLEERLHVTRSLERMAITSPADNPSGDDHEPGDDAMVGTAGSGPGDDTAIAARLSASLAEIDDTLHLLYEEPERYGICVSCGQPIASGRLEIVPTTRYCERHAPRG